MRPRRARDGRCESCLAPLRPTPPAPLPVPPRFSMRFQLALGCNASGHARRVLRSAAIVAAIGACDGTRSTEPSAAPPLTATSPTGTPFPVEFFVQAHQDDWQLFLGDRAVLAVPTANKLVFIYTTAGDAGAPASDGYWQERER